jgi:hypothetical protein
MLTRDATSAIYDHIIPAEWPWSRVVKRGQTPRIIVALVVVVGAVEERMDGLLAFAIARRTPCAFKAAPTSGWAPSSYPMRVG